MDVGLEIFKRFNGVDLHSFYKILKFSNILLAPPREFLCSPIQERLHKKRPSVTHLMTVIDKLSIFMILQFLFIKLFHNSVF